MKNGKVMIFDIKEYREEIKGFYRDILRDMVEDTICVGNCSIPDIIMEKGVDNLSFEEFVGIAKDYASIQMDMNESWDAIILRNGTVNVLLTEDISIVMPEKESTPENTENVEKPILMGE